MNKKSNVDPLVLAIVEARINALNLELGMRMYRQAFSVPTAHIRDLGTVLFDKNERTLSIGNFMPVHTAGSHIALAGMLEYIGRENIYPDDFIIGNDTFIVRAGHLADWSFLRPVYYEGEVVFYHYARTHQYDSGGAYPGCYFPGTYDCHGEGLMLPPVKLIERGKINESLYSAILQNVRGANMVRADNLLVYGSMKQIEERIIGLLKEYGKDTVMAALDELMDKARETVKKAISKYPAGTYYAERAADWDGTTDRPVWVRLAMTIKPEEGKIIFDFSESDSQVDFINVPLGQAWASVVSGLLWSMPPGIPPNQGLIDCVEMVTKEGTCLSPVYPATAASQAVTLGQEITECVMLAMAQVDPKETPALWGRHVNPLYVGKRRDKIDPRTGSIMEYTAHCFHAVASSGAVWGYDGADGSGSSPLGGGMVRAPIEVEEWMIPYIWHHYEFLTDSCGHGQFRGGLGTHVEAQNIYNREVWQALDCVIMSGNADGEKFGSVGLLGGTGGTKTRMEIERNGKRTHFRTMDLTYVEPEDSLITYSGGGGGVGDPLNREIENVKWDVMNEYISIKTAHDIYGVVIDQETFEVDNEATKALRSKLKDEKERRKA